MQMSNGISLGVGIRIVKIHLKARPVIWQVPTLRQPGTKHLVPQLKPGRSVTCLREYPFSRFPPLKKGFCFF